jgi:hypothetical protein
MKLHLGINLIYATKGWPEPDEWGRQVTQRWGLKHVQYCFDLLDPRTSPEARRVMTAKVREASAKYGSRSRAPSSGWELTPTICCSIPFRSSEKTR